ncbi:MAG: GNAT family N-acetyltransferase [Chloroflexota bacterium]|nr:GNAT family N-acetyltransferase [Chloroflexota bacterium]
MAEPLQFRAVGPGNWPDLARLFEARGGPKYCWCTLWRPGRKSDRQDPACKRSVLRRAVLGGTPVGLLAYSGPEPVGWCSVAPRETFRDLGGGAYAAGISVWAVVCFFVPRPMRRQRIQARLLDAACELATEAGADVIEGYPVDPGSPSYRFMGLVPTFLAAGFEEFGRIGKRRHAMRRWLGAARG